MIIRVKYYRWFRVRKVAVQNDLNDASSNYNPILETFIVIAIDPIDDVKGAIWTESKQVV